LYLNFLVGNRVLKKLEETFNRELAFTQLLQGGPQDHESLVKKMKSALQSSQKTVARVSKELAVIEAGKVGEISNRDYYFLHRADGLDQTFVQLFWKNLKLKNKSMFIFVSLCDSVDSQTGNISMQGDPKDITELKDKVCEILNGKGNGKGERFQAKVSNLNKLKEVEKLVGNYFKSKKEE
jgi:misacylated tRNA(Ala) deacylase